MVEALTTAERLSDRFQKELRPQLQTDLGLVNIMQVPKLTKIVINMGVGEATQQSKLIDGAVSDLTTISGQKPLITKAKVSISNFRLREGQAIGTKVTLRGERMYEFFDRLMRILRPFDAPGHPPHPRLPRPKPSVIRRPRKLHVRGNRTIGLPRNRLRQDRPNPRNGHHHRDDRQHR